MTTSEKALALCHAIEVAGCSEQLTKCSVLASEIRTDIQTESARIAALAGKMKKFVGENYPEDANGQVDFARALIEGYAAELTDAEADK